ncbi:MAG: response regulator [Candidatus Riflebacteria bacterium]|nr:response regulator [Candidatus Riflebacteria bacterium]
MKFLGKFATAIILTGLFFAGVIYYFTWNSNVKTLEKLAKKDLRIIGINILDKFDRHFFERMCDMKVISQDSVLTSRDSTPAEITRKLILYRNSYKTYFSLSFFDMDLRRIADTSGVSLGLRHSLKKNMDAALHGKISIAEDVRISEGLKVPMIYFSAPVKDNDGIQIGVVVARMSIDRLNDIVRNADNQENEGEEVFIDLMDKKGILLYSDHDNKGILKEMADEWKFLKDLNMDKPGYIDEHICHTGEKSILFFCRERGYLDFPGNGWVLFIHTPTRIIRAPIDAVRNEWLMIGIPGVAIAAILAYLFSLFLSRPLSELRNVVMEITRGNLQMQVDASSNDEIGELGKSFNLMVENLKTSITSLKNEIFTREALARQISEQAEILREMNKQLENSLIKENELKEKAECANVAKSNFLANMSHEIRTPMNAIIGMSHLALKAETNPNQRNYLEKILFSGNSLLTIINDILDFSKIEAGKLELESVEFRLDEVLDGVANIIGFQATQKELEVLFDLEPCLPLRVTGDPLRLGQILINLVSNAVKFTNSGEVIISIRCLKDDTQKRIATLQFCVQDTGIGMTQEQVSQLFQSFTQADTSITRKYGGTGLGLAITKALLEKMGGQICVESVPDVGTKFIFSADFPYSGKKSKPGELFQGDFQGMRVLVADDNKSCRDILQSQLESFSLNAKTVSSGFEAIEELKRTSQSSGEPHYKLILMDWKMPELNGCEAARKIKDEIAFSEPLHIVLVSAFGNEEIGSDLNSSLFDAVLHKPVKPSTLLDVILTIFGEEAAVSPNTVRKDDSLKNDNYFSGRKALVVEDNKINQKIAQGFLKSAGMQVEIAEDGLEAVNRINNRSEQFDIVFMDLQMPKMDGHEATKLIKSKYPDLPIAAMTAHVYQDEREKCAESGMDDFLSKPMDPEKLFDILKRWVKPCEKLPEKTQEMHEKSADDKILSDKIAFSSILNVIKLDEALARIRGDRQLFRKVLFDFYANHADALQKIQSYLENNELENVLKTLHSLKGVAGNISAFNLFQSVREFESLLKNPEKPDYSNALLNTKKHFTALMDAIAQLKAYHKESKSTILMSPTKKIEEIDLAVVSELFSDLVVALKDNSYSANKLVRKILTLLADTEFENEMRLIEEYMEKFDFEKALQSLLKTAFHMKIVIDGEINE